MKSESIIQQESQGTSTVIPTVLSDPGVVTRVNVTSVVESIIARIHEKIKAQGF